MQKFHKWYYFACVYGLNFAEAKIPRDIFNTLDFQLNVELAELTKQETWVCEPKSYKSNTIEPIDYLACVYGLNFVEAKIPRDIFNTLDSQLNVELAELHTIYYLQMLDITMMTIWCM
jgi:hypothetical protein